MPLDQSNLAGALQAFRQQRQQNQQGPGMAGFGQRFPRQNPNPGPLPPGFGGMGGGQRFPQPQPAPGGGYDSSGINPGAGAPRIPGGFGMGQQPGPIMQPQAPPAGGPAPMPQGGNRLPAPSQNPGPLPPGMGDPVPRRVPPFQRPEARGMAVPADSNPILIHNPQQPKAMAL